jgi:acetyl esterase/lipase
MIQKLAATLVAFAVAFSALAAEIPMPAPRVVATPRGQEDSYPAQDVTFPNGVRGKPGLVYREAAGYRALTLDLYLPPKTVGRPAQGFPLVIFIHGGAFLVGDSRHNPPFADFPGVLASLSARGYVVASVEYRLSGEAVFPAAIRDVKAAIRWLRSHASDYEIDPARAMSWGASAGGNLAGLAAVSCHAPLLEPVTKDNDISDCVQGAVSWYGVFDIATMASQAREENGSWRSVWNSPEYLMLGCFASECKGGQIAAASAVSYVNAQDPPMLLIVGAEDKTVPYHQTLEMAEKLKAAGVPHELLVIPDVDHGFIGKTSEQTREANLKALDATFRFIDKTMNNVH